MRPDPTPMLRKVRPWQFEQLQSAATAPHSLQAGMAPGLETPRGPRQRVQRAGSRQVAQAIHGE